MRGHNQRGIALLGKADQGGWLVETFDDAIADEKALIDHVIEPDIARGKEGDDSFCAPGTRDFLVMAEGFRQIDNENGTFVRPPGECWLYFALARPMPSAISWCASSAPPQRNTFTHFPGSRSL